MNPVRDTSKIPPEIHLAGAISDGTSNYIENMEAQGQKELVNSTQLPTEIHGDKQDFEALGFRFAEPNENDPLFCEAEIPEGWKREGSDHAMWSKIVDDRGLERVGIFYKAAFYDRRAFMFLSSVGRKVVDAYLYHDTPIPWDVLTEEEVEAAKASLRVEAENDPRFYKDKPAKAQAVLESLL